MAIFRIVGTLAVIIRIMGAFAVVMSGVVAMVSNENTPSGSDLSNGDQPEYVDDDNLGPVDDDSSGSVRVVYVLHSLWLFPVFLYVTLRFGYLCGSRRNSGWSGYTNWYSLKPRSSFVTAA